MRERRFGSKESKSKSLTPVGLEPMTSGFDRTLYRYKCEQAKKRKKANTKTFSLSGITLTFFVVALAFCCFLLPTAQEPKTGWLVSWPLCLGKGGFIRIFH